MTPMWKPSRWTLTTACRSISQVRTFTRRSVNPALIRVRATVNRRGFHFRKRGSRAIWLNALALCQMAPSWPMVIPCRSCQCRIHFGGQLRLSSHFRMACPFGLTRLPWNARSLVRPSLLRHLIRSTARPGAAGWARVQSVGLLPW
jgi:hypothetical protein